jgi:hypothetical protein
LGARPNGRSDFCFGVAPEESGTLLGEEKIV